MQTEIVKLTERRTIAVYSTDDVEPILDHNKLLRTIGRKAIGGVMSRPFPTSSASSGSTRNGSAATHPLPVARVG
jgi:hypothetical protein